MNLRVAFVYNFFLSLSIDKDNSIKKWQSFKPLTGIDAGLLTTTMSSSMCTIVIGWLVTGTSCLEKIRTHTCLVKQILFVVVVVLSLDGGFKFALCKWKTETRKTQRNTKYKMENGLDRKKT